MAVIKPFKGIRPAKDKVHLVASRPVSGYSNAQLSSKLAENPYTFLHVIKPEFRETTKSKPGSPEQLQKIKKKFLQFMQDEILSSDAEESFYIYEQIKDGHAFTGIIACASIRDYFNNVIKKHEQTISDKEEKLKHYLEVCDFNAEPVCLCYPDNETISKIISGALAKEPACDFTTNDRIEHKLWKVSDKKTIDEIVSAFSKIPSVYIADGHHRIASSALLGKSCKEKNKNYTGNEPCNFFMAAFFSESNLKIYDYNRIVKDLNFLSKDIFLRKLSANFFIEEKGAAPYYPNRQGNFSMYVEEKWYSLTLKNPHKEKLDAELLTELILSPLLNIHDLRTDKRIFFISGTKGIGELKKIIDNGKAMAGFGLFPVTVRDIINVADSGGTMPPKSTWVEPKMRSGLVMYSLSELNTK
ncbi:MAG: DUF1015 domain-containing protein [Bacteroidetes bacterium]|nr:DUF1015 domain-containing protein [Bacteroidota bacterium]